MTEKKEVKSAPKAAKKSTTKKASAKKAVAAVAINAENVGFKAGDVYNALAAEAKALSVRRDCQGSEDYFRRGLSWYRLALQGGQGERTKTAR